MLLYKTKEYKGYGKQNYNWYEYMLECDNIVKYKCNRHKFFDGHENSWETSKDVFEIIPKDAPYVPDWLRKRIPGE